MANLLALYPRVPMEQAAAVHLYRQGRCRSAGPCRRSWPSSTPMVAGAVTHIMRFTGYTVHGAGRMGALLHTECGGGPLWYLLLATPGCTALWAVLLHMGAVCAVFSYIGALCYLAAACAVVAYTYGVLVWTCYRGWLAAFSYAGLSALGPPHHLYDEECISGIPPHQRPPGPSLGFRTLWSCTSS